MNEEELNDIMALLRKAGVDAEWCDTPVRLSSITAHCGDPADLGDDDASEYVMLPKAVLGMHPEMFIPVEGDSMRDAGYEPGDRLRVRFEVKAYDGDNVLALIDGRCTVKTLFTDEDGQRWLVPQNEDYDAILLDEDMDVRLLGVVVGVEKRTDRVSSRNCLKTIRRTRDRMKKAQRLSTEEIDERLQSIGDMVMHGRQWFAVYRAMCDRDLITQGDYVGFCERVRTLLPEHKHLPEPRELSTMNVQSFSKPVALWVETNAPASGKRFRDYLNIALKMGVLLAGKD